MKNLTMMKKLQTILNGLIAVLSVIIGKIAILKPDASPRRSTSHPILAAFLVVLGLLGMSEVSWGQTTRTATTGNWGTAATWSPSGVPAANDPVIIPNGVTVTVNTTSANCASVAINTSTGGTGILQFNSGSVLVVSGSVTMGGSGSRIGNLTMTNGGTLKIGGSLTVTQGTFTPGLGTVEFNGTGATTIPAQNFYNLTISGARTVTNNVTFASSGTIGVSGTFSATATFTSGSYLITGSTINFNGTGAQTIPSFNYNNLTISGARTSNNVTLSPTGTIGIAGNLSYTATYTTGSLINTGSTINFNGTGPSTVAAIAYNNLTISGARLTNDVTFAGGCTINGNLTISATGTSASGFVYFNNTTTARTFTINGNYVQSGAIDVEFGTQSTGTTTINLGGDFIKSNGYMVSTASVPNANIILSGTNNLLQCNGGTEAKWVDFSIENGAVYTLQNGFTFTGSANTTSTFTIKSGGKLSTG